MSTLIHAGQTEMDPNGYFVFALPNGDNVGKLSVSEFLAYAATLTDRIVDADADSTLGFLTDDVLTLTILALLKLNMNATTTTIQQTNGSNTSSIVQTQNDLNVTLSDGAITVRITLSNAGDLQLISGVGTDSVIRGITTNGIQDTINDGSSTNTLASFSTSTQNDVTDGSISGSINLMNNSIVLLVQDVATFLWRNSIEIVQGKIEVWTSDAPINLKFSGTASLTINASAGTSGQVLRSNGAGAAPSWGYPSHYSAPFIIADWAAGTTLTVLAATHLRGTGLHHVTVFDSSGNIVMYGVPLSAINVDSGTGNVVLTGVAFDGSIVID